MERGRVVSRKPRARDVTRGAARVAGASVAPCSHRADPSARVRSERSVLSCRIIAGVRPSVRTEVVISCHPHLAPRGSVARGSAGS